MFFPLRDDNPTFRRSLATFLIVGLNVAAWVFVQNLGLGEGLVDSVWRFGLIPGELLGRVVPGTPVPAGPGMVRVLDGMPKWWTVLTSMFMHGSWPHLIGNMWFLVIFGDNVEEAMGAFRFLVFYLLCGVAAAAAQVLAHPAALVPMVGASGAIGGVMGAYMRIYPLAPVHVLVWFGFLVERIVVPAFFMLGNWFLMQLLLGVVPSAGGGVAFWAHAGGFAAGFLLVGLFCRSGRLAACRSRRGQVRRLCRRA